VPLPVDFQGFPGIRRLAAEYIANFDVLRPFFAGNPSDDGAWQALIAARTRPDGGGAAIRRIVGAQQRARGAPESAIEAAARLDDPRSVAVVTGQQAGLFGGPLYTLLKAVSAIRLARHVERVFGVPGVPVFWVDSEDHDLDEIRTCGVLDADQAFTTVALTIAAPPGTPAAAVRLGREIEPALDALAAALPETDFTAGVLGDLRRAYANGSGLVTAFATWIEQLLGRHGLVVFDAADPAAKPLAADLFAREIATAGTSTSLARAAGGRLRDAGFHAQVEPPANGVSLFLQDGDRRAIRTDGDRLRAGNEALDRTAWLHRLRADAASFSPNVLLRPIVQDRLFPTVCYVAGPNELAYLAQLKPVYAHFGVPMPLVAPRLSATLVDPAVMKFLRRTEIALPTLQPQDESALNRLLGAQLPAAVEQALDAAGDAIRDRMAAVAAAVADVDPTLTGAAESTRGRMERDLGNLQNKVVQAAKRRHQTLRRQFTRAQSQIFPHGSAQERAIGGICFLNRYGDTLLDRLLSDTTLDTSRHWVVAV
jgi:bacillithiol biosynthesis cysteine-adding enzyme BshC